MKKIFFMLTSLFIINNVFAYNVVVKNKMSYFGSDNENLILVADTDADIEPQFYNNLSWDQQVLSATIDDNILINNDLFKTLSQWDSLSPSAWAVVNYRVFLLDNSNNEIYLGYFTFTIHSNPNDQQIISDARFNNAGMDQNVYYFDPEPGISQLQDGTFAIYATLKTK